MELSPKFTTYLDTKQISIDIIPLILYDLHGFKLDINRNKRKLTDPWKLNNNAHTTT